ncbi:PREDICTED: topless-related protein 2-like [Brassica oleracea var. oleracea]|uniref:topless-related protein 2-like n=1 Tax=Brassica oleracea var. oleracea TaxID=109376 RepID=UPI0006A70FC5|nr:PREDICTED: topless-related protein 2-like [Brassica oleracea var. oleracea]
MVNIYMLLLDSKVMLRWSRNLFFSNIMPFEEKGLADEWEKVGMYLSGFNKLDDNRFSMEILFEIRTKKCQKVYEDLYKEMTQLLTRDHFRNMNPSDDAVVDDKAPLWIYVNKIEKIAEGRSWRFEYKFCSNTYVGSYTRVVTHLLQEGIKGIKECLKVTPQQKINMKKLVNDCKERIKRAASTPVPLPSSSRKASASSLNYDMTYKFPDTSDTESKKRKGMGSALEKAFNNQARAV